MSVTSETAKGNTLSAEIPDDKNVQDEHQLDLEQEQHGSQEQPMSALGQHGFQEQPVLALGQHGSQEQPMSALGQAYGQDPYLDMRDSHGTETEEVIEDPVTFLRNMIQEVRNEQKRALQEITQSQEANMRRLNQDHELNMNRMQQDQLESLKRAGSLVGDGMEKVAALRYGTMAKEQLELIKEEQTQLRTEVKETMEMAIQTTQEATLNVVTTENAQYHTKHAAGMEQVKEVLLNRETRIAEMMGSKHQDLLKALQFQFDRLLSQQEGQYNRLTETIKTSHTEFVGMVASAMRELTAASKNSTSAVTRSLSEMTTRISDSISQAIQQVTEVQQKEMIRTSRELVASMEKSSTTFTESLGCTVQNLSSMVDQVVIAGRTIKEDKKSKSTPSYHPEYTPRHLGLCAGNSMQESSDGHGNGHKDDITKVKKRRKPKHKRSSRCSESSTSSEGSDDNDDDNPDSIYSSRKVKSTSTKVHIPPFTGKETWKVWFGRFEHIAKRRHWSDEDKLDVLLPKLQGAAGTFVYDQLSEETRNNYKALKKELKNRFRIVENPKTYGAVFAGRNQKSTESVEDYAAELKKLYDKAHANRDHLTRQEDLLRRFLDGITSSEARFHVEFVKNPSTIDEAVDEVVNFLEVRKKQNKSGRQVKMIDNESSYDDMDNETDLEERIARLPGRPPKTSQNNDGAGASSNPQGDQPPVLATLEMMAKQLDDLKKEQQEFREMQRNTDKSNQQNLGSGLQSTRSPQRYQGQTQGRQQNNKPRQAANWQNNQQNLQQAPNYTQGMPICFRCNQPGHFIRDCPMPPLVMGHLQMLAGGMQGVQPLQQKPVNVVQPPVQNVQGAQLGMQQPQSSPSIAQASISNLQQIPGQSQPPSTVDSNVNVVNSSLPQPSGSAMGLDSPADILSSGAGNLFGPSQ